MKKLTRSFVVASVLAGLAACSSGPATLTLADGSMASRLECGVTTRALNTCLENAGKSCGAQGYSIVRSDGTIATSSAAVASGSGVRTVQSELDSSSLYIKCGG